MLTNINNLLGNATSKIHYYNINNIEYEKEDTLVYGHYLKDKLLDRNILDKAVDKNIKIILLLYELCNDEDLEYLSNDNIIIICDKLRHYQQLLSYKKDDTLYINHDRLELQKRIILLLRDKKRVNHIEQNVKPKLTSLKIFPAIDAMTPHAIDNFVLENHIPIIELIRAGKICCAFSHITLWKELVNSLSPSFLIMEDDIHPKKEWKEIIDKILEDIPITYDIIFMYVSPNFFRNDDYVKYNDQLNKHYYMEDISAYLISRKGARKLLKSITYLKEPIECIINKDNNLETYIVRNMPFENIGKKCATLDNILESNTYDSKLYHPENSESDDDLSTSYKIDIKKLYLSID